MEKDWWMLKRLICYMCSYSENGKRYYIFKATILTAIYEIKRTQLKMFRSAMNMYYDIKAFKRLFFAE